MLENIESCICRSLRSSSEDQAPLGKQMQVKSPEENPTAYGFHLGICTHHLDFLWLYIIPQSPGYLCWCKHNTFLYAKCWAVTPASWVERSRLRAFCTYFGRNNENCAKTSFSCSWGEPLLPHSHCGFGRSKDLMQHEVAPSERRWVLTCKM